MIKLDDAFLDSIGLGDLGIEDKNHLLTSIYKELETRVGGHLADRMSGRQLDEFQTYFDADDDAGAFAWLQRNFPEYREIVNDQFDHINEELSDYIALVRWVLLGEEPSG